MNTFVEILKTVLKMLMGGILVNALTDLFNSMWVRFCDWLWYQFCLMLYKLFRAELNVLDLMEKMFNVFSGISKVTVVENGKARHLTLIDYMMSGSVITRVLIYITILAAMLGFIFAIIATARSIADSSVGGEQYPLSKVLRSGLKAAIGFAWVPFFCLLVQHLAAAVLSGIVSGMSLAISDSSTKMADQIFLAVSQDALKTNANMSVVNKEYFYQSLEKVTANMDITKIHYFMGYFVCIPLVLILLFSGLQFIRRLYDLLVLYVISPMFTSTIALDDGAMFKKWRELFVGKYFASFASVITMRVYILIVPTLTKKNELVISDFWLKNYLFYAIMLLGGAWSIYKAQETLMRVLTSKEVADSNIQANALVAGYIQDSVTDSLAAKNKDGDGNKGGGDNNSGGSNPGGSNSGGGNSGGGSGGSEGGQ